MATYKISTGRITPPKRLPVWKRRLASVQKEMSPADTLRLVSSYKKKAVSRLKTFYAESQLMDKKLQELLEKAKALGVQIHKIKINSFDEENLLNYRKKTKTLSFFVEARRDEYELDGTLTITPASMKLELNSHKLRRITTRNGFPLPLFKITYYRTLNVRDNYLAALVGGGVHSTKIEDLEEVSF